MSQTSAEVYEPGEREVCISIRDPAAPLPGLSPRFIAVLSLEFQDDPEPGWEDRGRSITEAQADQVIEFVERHAAARRIVVHCLVGVSRSPSLAAGLLVAHRRWALLIQRGRCNWPNSPTCELKREVVSPAAWI
jgi:predicted protein tyrosine phosphatase